MLIGQLHAERRPVVAVSDSMRAVPDQVAAYVSGDWRSMGTDGFGFPTPAPHCAAT
jgi:pyruvate dehydrogenase E1 component